LFQVAEPETVPVKLHFFNSLSRQYEPFVPIAAKGPVTMYSCGPTVHRRPHLGILRRLVVDDLVRRTLELAGFAVRHVVSITDVDDLTMAEAERAGVPLHTLCRDHEAGFHADLATLGVKPAEEYVRPSECVPQMIATAKALLDKGYAYERLGSVYFNIARLSSYGELSAKDLGKIKVGATVDLDRYDKNDPRDFTLLRRSTLAEIRKGLAYKTDWGNVRPSLHIQCAAMARLKLGERFDIHSGSADLIFPHNENEIAQSRALSGEAGAKLWLHSELILVGNKKMTYEEEICVTLPDLLGRGYSGREVRFFLLQTHYRQPIHYADEQLEAARLSLRRFDALVSRLAQVAIDRPRLPDVDSWTRSCRDDFAKALFDDLNISAALAALFRLAKQVNHLLADAALGREDAAEVLGALRDLDAVLGLLPEAPPAVPAEVLELVRQRDVARREGDFARADALRETIVARGFVVRDSPGGTQLEPR
jgi:cysteinyl-tRNA synthetase